MDVPQPAQESPQSDRLRSLASLLRETDETIRSGAIPGARVWPTGFDALDTTLTGGLRSGELALLGGSHGEGKTTMAVQIMRNAVAAGRSAVIFSYEHEAHTLLERLISLEAYDLVGPGAATVHLIRKAFEQSTDARNLAELLATLPGGSEAYAALTAYGKRLYVHESSGTWTDLDEIAKVVATLAEATGQAPIVFVDYLQKVPILGETDELVQITTVTEGLKDLALEVGAPVVAVSAADKESLAAGHRMRTQDLRGSSSLAYEADVVLLLGNKASLVSREHLVYDLGNVDRFNQLSVVSVEKNRHGHSGMAMEFLKDFEHGRFVTEGNRVTERLIDNRIILT